MNHASIANLQRKLTRLEDQATRRLDTGKIEITCCWANEDQDQPRQPGVTYIVTDWSSVTLQREE